LTIAKRNALLLKMTQQVSQIVLQDNYNQAFVMSFSSFDSRKNILLHQRYIKELEDLSVLDRQLEYLPDDKKLVERKTQGLGLTRPELAVLLAYTKIYLKQQILKTDIPKDDYLKQSITNAFPSILLNKFKTAIAEHKLADDIIATELSNQIVDEMGITYIFRQQIETGANIQDIVRAYAISSEIFNTKELITTIQSFDFKIPLAMQYDMLFNTRHLINLATRWFLHGNRINGDLRKIIAHYSSNIKILKPLVTDLMVGSTHNYYQNLIIEFTKFGLDKSLAKIIAVNRVMYITLNIIEIASTNQLDLIKTAKVYFKVGEKFNLVWFRDIIASKSSENHWDALSRLTLRDELDIIQRSLTIAIIKRNKKENNINKLIDEWCELKKHILNRWQRLLAMVHEQENIDYSIFFIVLRELVGLIFVI
jgi:glutamate dehydrogenase